MPSESLFSNLAAAIAILFVTYMVCRMFFAEPLARHFARVAGKQVVDMPVVDR